MINNTDRLLPYPLTASFFQFTFCKIGFDFFKGLSHFLI